MSRPAVPSALAAPRVPARVVRRSRLLRAIDDAADLPLTVVVAGPGWGKTVLLSEWARTQSVAPAWISLSARYNRPQRFWNAYARAIWPYPSPGEAVTPAPSAIVTAAEVLDGIERQPTTNDDKRTVVLDDAHLLTDPDIIGPLDQVIRAMDGRMRLILAARSDPLLPVYRYRLAGIMAELRAADLAMTDAETEALLEAHGVRLPASRVAVLTARTEGWVAGVRLSALRMEHSPTPDTFIDEFALDEGSIGEYLIGEVLNNLSARVRQLLIETSFLEEIDASLAAAMTGDERARDDLAQLSQANSFITAVDSTRHRFRVHQLMREILAYLFSELPRQRQRERYLGAARWFAAHADPVSAIRWALAANDSATVASTLVTGGLANAYATPNYRAELALIDFGGTAAELAQQSVATDSLSCAARCAIQALRSDAAEARAALATIPTRRDVEPGSAAESATRELARLMLAERAGEHQIVKQVVNDSAGAICAAFPDVVGLSAMLTLACARARYSLGDAEHVDDLIAQALGQAQTVGAAAAEIEVWAFRATVDALETRMRHASDALDRANALLAAHPETARTRQLDVAIAHRAYVLNDRAVLEQAARRLRADNGAEHYGPSAAVTALIEARSMLMSGALADAAAALKSSAALGAYPADVHAVARDCELADIDTRLGRPHAALRRLRDHLNTPLELQTAPAAARAHLALGELAQARSKIRAVLTAGRHVSRLLVIEAMLCEAAAELTDRDDAAAVECVERAIQLATGDVVRPFAAALDDFRALLGHHPAVGDTWPGGVSAPASDAGPIRPQLIHVLPDPLTEREQAVLRLLCTSLSGNDIAGELCVSIHTVRTHQAAIYRKLSARNRREAVRRARTFELI